MGTTPVKAKSAAELVAVLTLCAVLLLCGVFAYRIYQAQEVIREQFPETSEPDSVDVQRENIKRAYAAVRSGAPVDTTGRHGETLLMHAAWLDDVDGVAFLLKRGADVRRTTDEGVTALHSAAGAGGPKVLKLLMDAGAQVNAQDASGWTPIMGACNWNNVSNIRLLLHNGANPRIRGARGEACLTIAADTWRSSAVRVLLEDKSVSVDEITEAIVVAQRRLDAERKYGSGPRGEVGIRRNIAALRAALARRRMPSGRTASGLPTRD